MNLAGSMIYHWNVDLVGRLLLFLGRRGSARRRAAAARWENDHLAPPLKISARTSELVFRHYHEGRYANRGRKVAWVTSGAPVELLKAMGFYTLYPENHAALCGTRRKGLDIVMQAEDAGYSRDLCSYARTDLGALLSGMTPVGRLPKPDLLLACTNICQTVLFWYRLLAHHFAVPLVLIDTPFLYDHPGEHAVRYVQRQLEEAIPIFEQVTGKPFDLKNFERVVHLSRTATQLWMEVLDRAQHHPSPISVFDQFIHMAPIVEMRGEPHTVDFYAAMLEELDERIASGVGSVTEEKVRLLWDNLPIWYRLRYLAEFLAGRGAALIASTYTNAWGELAHLYDPDKPFESAARVYLHPILNQGTGHKLDTMLAMIEKYQLDGVILHSDRSCKPYSIGQMDQRERLARRHGVPALLLEADHNDPRAFAEEQVANRLEAFLEMLGV